VESDTEESEILEEREQVFAFQVLEVELVLQRLKFLWQSIRGCG
jgi:hypothetical protein